MANNTKLHLSKSDTLPNTEEELREQTESHVNDVNGTANWLMELFIGYCKHHDHTKLSNMTDFFNALKSGKIKESEWYDDHIRIERHHLRSMCPTDVTLLDVLEYTIDITVAGLARSGSVYEDDINLDPEILSRALRNTVKMISDASEADILDMYIEK